MYTFFKRIVLWVSLFLACGDAMAQAKFTTIVNPREAGVDELIEVEYVIENAKSAEKFIPPVFKNFKVVRGPSQSENVTVINGSMTRSISISYVLQPEATGNFTIEGASATIDGKTLRSENVAVVISKKGSGGGQKNAQPRNVPMPFSMDDFFEERAPIQEEYRLLPGEDVKEKIAKNLQVRLDINKTTCYEGEPVMATYKLCSRLKSESRIMKRPSLNGFSVYDMMDPSDNHLKVEKINGKNFNVHIIRRSQLFPLQAGSYTLDPVELENKVQFMRVSNNANPSRSRNPVQRMMEEFFGRGEEAGEVEEHTITMRSNPVTITVKPLPQENRPANFKGAVGKFTIQADLKNKAIAAEDAALLEITIQGTGNLPVVNAPEIILPAGMEAFEPVVKENSDKTVYPLKGSKTFSYTFIAHDTGSFTIQPVQFSYFDPATASYKTIQSEPFPIRVLKSDKPGNTVLGAAEQNNKQSALSTGQSQTGKHDVPYLMLLIIVIMLGIIIILGIKNRGNSKRIAALKAETTIPGISNETMVPEKEKEVPIVKADVPDPLQEARMALHLGKSQEFYSEINKAIREAGSVHGGPLDEEIFSEMDAIRKECEIALYTPGYEDKDRQLILERTEQLMKAIR